MFKRCIECEKIVELRFDNCYEGINNDDVYCEECGNKLLIHNSDIDGYIKNEDNRLFYLDNELEDLMVFKYVESDVKE